MFLLAIPIAALKLSGHSINMTFTAIFVESAEGGFTGFVKENPAAISQGETLEEAQRNLTDALKLVLECQKDLGWG